MKAFSNIIIARSRKRRSKASEICYVLRIVPPALRESMQNYWL